MTMMTMTMMTLTVMTMTMMTMLMTVMTMLMTTVTKSMTKRGGQMIGMTLRQVKEAQVIGKCLQVSGNVSLSI